MISEIETIREKRLKYLNLEEIELGEKRVRKAIRNILSLPLFDNRSNVTKKYFNRIRVISTRSILYMKKKDR